MGRRGYPPEFRRRVLDLIESGRKIAEIAEEDLGISDQTIYTWRREDRIDRGLEAGLSSAEKSELVAARKRIRDLEAELGGASSSDGAAQRWGRPKRRFTAIEVMVAEGLPAQLACRVLDVSESGFYSWRTRPPSERTIRHAWLTDLIRQIHVDFRGVYGYRRVHAELTLGHGLEVGGEAVWLLMRKGRPPKD